MTRSSHTRASTLTRAASLRLLLAFVVSCDAADVMAPRYESVAEVGPSMALGIWSPSLTDTCSQAIHDSYSTVGPDGLRYPTWHPAVDPATGCTFGHEHGRDPSGSNLFAEVGPIPFGYANQHLMASGFDAHRHEDHVGHKIEWENNMPMRIGDGDGDATFSVTCDVLTKLHQGTHSADAFTNNLHEVAYHIRCTDGTAFSATLLTPIGTPGLMVAGCDRERSAAVGPATPPSSPSGGGKRALPDLACIQAHVAVAEGERPRFDRALHESWEISASLRRANGSTLVSFNPYFQVMDPSRYYDPAVGVRRPVDLCYDPAIGRRDRCESVPEEQIAWNDPRSPFKGVRRFVDVNANTIRNSDGPNVWYTDPFGRNGRTEPFPGSIRQWVARRNNEGLNLHGGVMGKNRDYNAPGVRAPN